MKIFVVDDEQDICEILQYNLENEGYEVFTANSAEEALRLLDSVVPNLFLLDVMMDGMSGFQLARRLKDNPTTAQIPIIFVTALEGEDDMVKGLNLGADDYIAKPLSIKEVKARVKAVLRRTTIQVQNHTYQSKPATSPKSVSQISYQGITLDLDSKSVTIDGAPIQLTKLEFELLRFFLQNANKVYSRDELLHRCWPQDVYVLDRTVDVNITRLRRKIGHYGSQIKTRVGYGYCFEK